MMTPSSARRFTVGAFGMLTWDQMLVVDSYPDAGGYRIVRHVSEQPGGTTGNIVEALARLDVDVALSSRVGDDPQGLRILRDLAARKIDFEHVLVNQDEPTDRGVIIVSGEGVDSDRTIYWLQGARLKHGDYLPIEAFFARDLVIVDIDDARLRLLLLDLPMHVSPRTRILGTMTYLEELEPEQGLDLALRHDYLCGNARELKHITGRTSLEEAMTRFQDEMVLSQVRFVAVSLGADGCVMFDRDRSVHVPAFAVNAIDPTGAGDAFAAGVAYSILNRWTLETTGRFANAMGAMATRKLGARASLPPLDEVYAFLESSQQRTECSDAGSRP
jgi:sugar/nucleoside kinase (ribokinase family)